MVERLPALIFGLLLVAGGAVMLWSHVNTWRRRREDATLSDQDRQYYHRQYRRRVQVSGLVVVIGIMLPIGDLEGPWKDNPGWWAMYWFVVLALALWIMLLAFGDLASTRSYSQAAMSRLREQQRALEQEAARLKARSSNRPSER